MRLDSSVGHNGKNYKDDVKTVENKFRYLSISVVSMVFAMLLGIVLEDPVASTAAAVAIPFSAIALIWPNHVRHLQRARFYPLFIFAMHPLHSPSNKTSFLSIISAITVVKFALLC